MMIEDIRWVWHDMKTGSPKTGSIPVADRHYQVLQVKIDGEWYTVPHRGLQPTSAPNPSTEG